MELDKLLVSAKPSVFGTAQGHKDVRLDLNATSCLRFHVEGTRKLALLPLHEVLDYLSSKRKGKEIYNDEAYTWIRSELTAEITQDYLDAGNTIFWGSVGPRQGIWLPAGYIVTEHTVNNVDCIGVRLGLFHGTDDVKHIEVYIKELEATGITTSATPVFFVCLMIV